LQDQGYYLFMISNKFMDENKAADILMQVIRNHSLKDEEKEAVLTAIGLLGMASSAQKQFRSQLRARKDKQERSTKW
jgi:hypothetical protein